MRSGLDIPSILLGLTGGLVLFLHGIGLLSSSLKAVAGPRLKRLIARFTTNRYAGVGTGAAATAALQSSSATTIMAVGLVNAGAMDLSQSLGVVMGANIGTTLTSQVFAFDLMHYGPLVMLAGLLLAALGRSPGWRELGGVVLGLGLVFFALDLMGEATRPLRDHEPFVEFLCRLENPVWGVLAGAAFTAVIQSSSAMMGILITMVGQGSMTLDAAVAIMLGAEIGTCLDTLVATIGRSREAVRVGVFQLVFNVASVLLFLGLTDPLARLAAWTAPEDVERQLANAHVLFNVTSVVVFLGFTRTAAGLVRRLIPGGPDADAAEPEPGGEPAPA